MALQVDVACFLTAVNSLVDVTLPLPYTSRLQWLKRKGQPEYYEAAGVVDYIPMFAFM